VTDLKPVTALRGVGDALALRLRALGVETTQDMLFLPAVALRGSHSRGPPGRMLPGQRARG